MGEEPSAEEPQLVLHSCITKRWKKYMTEGLRKEDKEELLKKFPRAGKFSLDPPILNEEVSGSLKESAVKRDNYFCWTQKLAENIWAASKLLVEIHRSQTVAKKACILPTLSKQWASTLEKRVTDNYLFGDKLQSLNYRSSSSQVKSGSQASYKNVFPKKPLTSKNQSNQSKQSNYPKSNQYQYNRHRTQARRLLMIGAIVKAEPVADQFLSPFFLVPKSDGQQRFILNLKGLNFFIQTEHFKLEDLRSACNLLELGCFMGTVDLKDAYFLIPVWADHRKFLRFIFEGQIYEFICLPFGLCSSPQVFTKLLKPVVGFLRLKGFSSVVYLDDFLCLGSSFQECRENLNATKKSLLQQIKSFQLKKSVKIREFAKLVGCLVACCPAIDYSLLHCRLFEREKIKALQKNEDSYDAIIFSDASLSGWGAFCENENANG
ncbi:GSCOCG00005285001-RA-CDS [Cotesia congregata]|nr:GSCOCG00005285001-RA-CDS [Cotesia congregata]